MAKNSENMAEEVQKVLDRLREGILLHGGDVELVKVDAEKGRVEVRMHGACVGCPFAEMTLKAGIEETLCEMVPGVKEVVAVE